MKLISELVEEVQVLVEEDKETKKKDYFIEGVFLQANLKNKNGRMYTTEVLDREVERYKNEYIKKNRAFGELGHPQGPTLNLERASHITKKLERDGDNYIGRAKIMDTPYGNIVKNIMDEGGVVGVSSRGMGSLKENDKGVMVVQDDFYLATAADIVADPSAPDAFVRGVMEGVEWVWDNGIIKAQKIEEIKKDIVKAKSRNLSEAKVNAFKKFFNELSKS
jgi:hypothetical protein